MNKHQSEALAQVIETDEQLKKAWERAREYKFPNLTSINPRRVLVNLNVSIEQGALKWIAGVRLYHVKNRRMKPVKDWTPYESATLSRLLNGQVEGVGDPDSDVTFQTAVGAHLLRNLTEEEIALLPENKEVPETEDNPLETQTSERII